ncbi:hypothetical protein H5410_056870, partial [Solanum commersonii]
SVNDENVLAFIRVNNPDSVSKILREVPGNDKCSDCECSGIYRNLGVISQRSITLDVRVWEPTILDLFRTLGNSYCNSMWEKLLQLPSEGLTNVDAIQSASKPSLKDAFHEKEKYILAKAMLLSVADKATLEKCCLNSKVTLLLGTPGKVLLKVQKCSLLSKATLFASLGYTLLGWP